MRMAAMATPTNSKYSWMWQMELDESGSVEAVGVDVDDAADAWYAPLMQLMSAVVEFIAGVGVVMLLVHGILP